MAAWLQDIRSHVADAANVRFGTGETEEQEIELTDYALPEPYIRLTEEASDFRVWRNNGMADENINYEDMRTISLSTAIYRGAYARRFTKKDGI